MHHRSGRDPPASGRRGGGGGRPPFRTMSLLRELRAHPIYQLHPTTSISTRTNPTNVPPTPRPEPTSFASFLDETFSGKQSELDHRHREERDGLQKLRTQTQEKYDAI